MGSEDASVLFNGAFWRRRVLVTGATGFKGTWLLAWLKELGAEVTCTALKSPPSTPNACDVLGFREAFMWSFGDVRDRHWLQDIITNYAPEVIIHLAAQPIVLRSYKEPYETISTNVLGTASVLDAVRLTPSVRACVVVTSDKCYALGTTPRQEGDALGGNDLYSMSKAASELLTVAYRKSFFASSGVGVATARAGNVMGGGDWSRYRLVPDTMVAWHRGQSVPIRNPESVRPWQHVLEPLSGYLWLASCLLSAPVEYSDAWNFGPKGSDAVTVRELVNLLSSHWSMGESAWHLDQTKFSPEGHALELDIQKARSRLDWCPVWRLPQAVARTVDWYQEYYATGASKSRLLELTTSQIATYVRDAKSAGLRWALPTEARANS